MRASPMQPAASIAPDAAPSAELAPAGTSLPTVEELLDDEAAAAQEVAPAPRYRLPQAAVPPNIMLQSAVTRLVEQKEQIDQIARNGLLAGLLPAEWNSSPGNELRAFVASVVPFASDAARGETIAARVPLKFLLGHSQRWGVQDVAEPRSLSVFLSSDDRANSGTPEHAEVMLLAPLGLAWAHSGRSRVGFLRSMGLESMAARVTALPYPSAEQLALYQVSCEGTSQIWCVLDKRKLRALSAPALTLPLLAAYGVAVPQSWPSNWPDPADVGAELALARTGKTVAEVDLVKLVDKIGRNRAGESWTGASLMQLHTWVPRWRLFLASFIGLPAGLLLLAALALPGHVEAAAVAAALGFAGGAIAALAAPWIYARRKHLS
ncbi:hypothetical protein [Stenotrophomonas sp.]|uniref:hypothetical protein n=1 Tax=Stenotrophomonas sp. TaxID=69392 RepID=UPI0028A7F62A|nr:hypothetical protein [Stenotrophomonas sp.]